MVSDQRAAGMNGMDRGTFWSALGAFAGVAGTGLTVSNPIIGFALTALGVVGVLGTLALAHTGWRTKGKKVIGPFLVMGLGVALLLGGAVWLYYSNPETSAKKTHNTSSIRVLAPPSFGFSSHVPTRPGGHPSGVASVLKIGPWYVTNVSRERQVTLEIRATLENNAGKRHFLGGEGTHWAGMAEITKPMFQPDEGQKLLLSPLKIQPNETVYGQLVFISQLGPIESFESYGITVTMTDVSTGEVLTVLVREKP